MIRRILIVLLLAVLAGGCIEGVCKENDSINVWALATSELDSPDNEFQGRIGLQRENLEAGAESSWIGKDGDNQSYGAYVLTFFDPTPIGTPYVGYHATVANSDEMGFYGPITGTAFLIGDIETIVEYQYKDFTGDFADADYNDRHRVFAGVRVKF